MRNNSTATDYSKPDLLGKRVREAREAKDLSVYALAKLTNIHRSTLQLLEDGEIRNPSPEYLARIADALELELIDLYPLAGYAIPKGLPDFDGYMAVKFRGLPSDAIEEVAGHLKYLQAKHGLEPTGPAPGEDETDESTEPQ